MALTFSLFVGWYDERRSWISESPNLIETLVSPEEIWKPTFYIAGCISEDCVFKPDMEKIKINKTGFVSYQVMRKVDIICDLVLDDFPFDYQICSVHLVLQLGFLYFYNVSIENKQYFIKKTTENNVIIANGEWRISDLIKKDNITILVHKKIGNYNPLQGIDIDNRKDIGFTIIAKFQRYFWNYIFVLVLPCIVFSVLPVFVACVPKESGEKLGFSIVVLLTFIFFESLFLTLVPNATTLPWLMLFLFVGSIFSFIFLLYTFGVMLSYDLDILFPKKLLQLPTKCKWKNHHSLISRIFNKKSINLLC